jgi:hypothetical protein
MCDQGRHYEGHMLRDQWWGSGHQAAGAPCAAEQTLQASVYMQQQSNLTLAQTMSASVTGYSSGNEQQLAATSRSAGPFQLRPMFQSY